MRRIISEIHLLEGHHSLLELFDEPSLAERIRRTIRGLRQPSDSGEYKYAVLELQRLWAPVAGVLVPLLALLLLLLMRQVLREPIDPLFPVDSRPETPVEPLDPQQPMQPDADVAPLIDPALFTVQDEPVAQTPLGNQTETLIDGVDTVLPVPGLVPSMRLPQVFGLPFGLLREQVRIGGLKDHRIPGATDIAVLRALRWLKKHQERDGNWVARSGGGPDHHDGAATALTGLALLAFLGHGETPASTEFGATVERALRWLVASQKPDGRFSSNDPNEYSLPIAAYALCEAFGLIHLPVLRTAAEQAVQVVIDGQNDGGLWNYKCARGDRNDTSYSGWCAQALKAAELARLNNLGLTNAMRRAAAGFRNNYAPNNGAFLYTNSGDEKGGALTGVGVLCLQFLAHGKDPSVAGGLKRLDQATCNWKAPWVSDPLYAWYYVTQAKFQAGGRAWKRWNAEFWPQLVNNQIVISNAIEGPDGKPADIGYWPSASGRELGRSYVYNTTLCALTLEVYYRYLPTYRTPERSEDTATREEDRNEVPIRVL